MQLVNIVLDSAHYLKVCVFGYAIIGLAFLFFVQSKRVYPDMLLARLFFSVGGSATSTMVTAILPSMIALHSAEDLLSGSPVSVKSCNIPPARSSSASALQTLQDDAQQPLQPRDVLHTLSPKSSPVRLAGFVGFFSGLGALLAVVVFLPLPAIFLKSGVSSARAIANSFYVVGSLSILVSVFCFAGLRDLQDHASKGFYTGTRSAKPIKTATSLASEKQFPLIAQIFESIILGYKEPQVGLSYIGGFVARASSVGISLFIPLSVNAYFIQSGFCNEPVRDSQNPKDDCRAGYILASTLTGVSQLVALVCAPMFGYLADRYRRFNIPLLSASLAGLIGYVAMIALKSPEPSGENGTLWIFLVVALLGISQIGTIVCSLGLLGHCVLMLETSASSQNFDSSTQGVADLTSDSPSGTSLTSPNLLCPRELNIGEVADDTRETEQLLRVPASARRSYQTKRGSIAGVYSLAGGAGILLLTKLGGYSFDRVSRAAPFYLLALFNALLLIACIACGILESIRI